MSDPILKASVAAILRNREGKILVCERINNKGAWQFPQGGIDDGETAEEALTRELAEEIGVGPGDFRIVRRNDGYRYVYPDGRKRGHDGKIQAYFLCDFVGDDSAINVATEHPEFRAWKWIRPEDFRREWLPQMKLEVYQAVLRDFFAVKL